MLPPDNTRGLASLANQKVKVTCECGATWTIAPSDEIQVILCSCGRALQFELQAQEASVDNAQSHFAHKTSRGTRAPTNSDRIRKAIHVVGMSAVLIATTAGLVALLRPDLFGRTSSRQPLLPSAPAPEPRIAAPPERPRATVPQWSESRGAAREEPVSDIRLDTLSLEQMARMKAPGRFPQGTFSQPAPTESNCVASSELRWPSNGTELTKAAGKGLGELKVSNGTAHDAVVILLRSNARKADRALYVRAGDTAILHAIRAGTYTTKFAAGTEWDTVRRRFCNATYSEFTEPVDFTEVPSADGTTYSTWELTLHPTVGGTAKIERSDSAGFSY